MDDLFDWIVKSLVLFAFLMGLAFIGHSMTTRDFVKSGDNIYSWIYYTCIDGVLYRDGRSYTLIVNSDGTPKTCEIVQMTNGEFNGWW